VATALVVACVVGKAIIGSAVARAGWTARYYINDQFAGYERSSEFRAFDATSIQRRFRKHLYARTGGKPE
jgi:hypothetical protein